MKKEAYNKLEDKYFEGQTSLEEERSLLDAESNEYFASIKELKNRTERSIPTGLKDSVWSEINKRNNQNNIRRISFCAAAASVAIILSVSIFLNNGNEFKNKEEISYQEALSMFESKHAVLYEDELIIIYK